MKLGDRQDISDSQLIGNWVLDRHNYLLGKVSTVNVLPDNQSALVVQFPTSRNELNDLVIESHHVMTVDPDEKIIQTDLDFNSVVPQKGKVIPLVQEELVVSHQRLKLAEIVVRKVTETDWVQIPVRREKLVVKREGKTEPLAEIRLGETHVSSEQAIALQTPPQTSVKEDGRWQSETLGYWQSVDRVIKALHALADRKATTNITISVTLFLSGSDPAEQVRLEFASPVTASRMLAAIANGWWHQCTGIQVEQNLKET